MMTAHTMTRLGLVALLGGAIGVIGVPAGNAAPAAPISAQQGDGQDIVHMNDGRILTGKIINETADVIVFRYVDPNLGMTSQLTLRKADVLHIERDVAADSAAQPGAAAAEPAEPVELIEHRERGLTEGDADDESLPSVYVIPMKGQMGTDVRYEVYTSIVDDIRKRKPDVVVWVLESTDLQDEILGEDVEMRNPEEFGVMLLDDYRRLVQRLHDDLRGIRQVMWVHDAYGIGAVMALSWPEMYMTPNARLRGMELFFNEFGGDEDIKAKMREASIGVGNGFLARGGHPLELGYGLMNPKAYLSASWQGRRVVWRNDLQGEVIINNSQENVVWFRAKTAEDLAISKGTVDNLDDLAMLLGFREYRVLEGDALNSVVRYREQWRREFTTCWSRWLDYQQHMQWGGLQWISRARADLQYIRDAMVRFPAVEMRLRMRGVPSRLEIDMMIEQLQRQITEMNRRGGRGGGGRGPGGGG